MRQASAARTATPPTTPPAIAPAGADLDGDAGVVVVVGELVGLGETEVEDGPEVVGGNPEHSGLMRV